MDNATLIQLVGKMRESQRKYFKTRLTYDLDMSKSLERQVDKALEEYRQGPTLFDRPQVEAPSSCSPLPVSNMIAVVDDETA